MVSAASWRFSFIALAIPSRAKAITSGILNNDSVFGPYPAVKVSMSITSPYLMSFKKSWMAFSSILVLALISLASLLMSLAS
jgi:hypothetical protein